MRTERWAGWESDTGIILTGKYFSSETCPCLLPSGFVFHGEGGQAAHLGSDEEGLAGCEVNWRSLSPLQQK